MHARTKGGRNQGRETDAMKGVPSPQGKVYKLYSSERPVRPSPNADQETGIAISIVTMIMIPRIAMI